MAREPRGVYVNCGACATPRERIGCASTCRANRARARMPRRARAGAREHMTVTSRSVAHCKRCARNLRAVAARAQRCNRERTAAPDGARRQAHAQHWRDRSRAMRIYDNAPRIVTKSAAHRRAARELPVATRGTSGDTSEPVAATRAGGASRTSRAQAVSRQRARAQPRDGHINTRAAPQMARARRAPLSRAAAMM